VTENTVRPRHQTGQAEPPQVEEMAAFKKSAVAFGCGGKIVYRKTAGRHDKARAQPFLFNAAHPEFEPPASPSEAFHITIGRYRPAMLESLAAPYGFPCVVILNDKACRKRHS